MNPERGDIIWRYGADDSITSTPAVADGKVFFGSFDHHVYAVDAATGDLIWRHDTGQAVSASPIVDRDLVLVGGRSYEFLALNAETGERVWDRYFWFSWVDATVAVFDDLAIVGLSDGQLVSALQVASGEEVWKFDTGGSVWAQPAVTQDAVFIAAVGVPRYMVDHRGGFFAVDRTTGRELWRYPITEMRDRVAPYGFAASPAVGGGRVFAATLDGEVMAFDIGESHSNRHGPRLPRALAHDPNGQRPHRCAGLFPYSS